MGRSSTIPTRSREEILAGQTVIGQEVWTVCGNCQGTGAFPSSMLPPGRCRYYCWEGRTPETFGKLPVSVEQFIKSCKAADRRAYRAECEAERLQAERLARLAGKPEPRIAVLAAAYELSLAEVAENSLSCLARSKGSHQTMAINFVQAWLRDGDLTPKQWGLVERLPSWAEERARKEADRAAERAKSIHVGTVGERLTLTVTVQAIKPFDTKFGTSQRVQMQDNAGNVLVWLTSSWTELEEGWVGQIKATIAEHKEWQGQQQTEVKRVAIISKDNQ